MIDEKTEDPEKRYKAILIANSDDSYPGHYFEDGVPREEKAAAAAAAVNQYTLLPLIRVFYEHIGNCWSVPYSYNPFSNTDYILSAYAWLKDKVFSQPDDGGKEDTPSEAPDEQAVPGADFAEKHNEMQTKDWIVYSPTEWIYHSSPDERNDNEEQDGSFLVFVHTSPDNLLNVYLDGERISARHGDFCLIDGKNASFLMLFSEEFMQKIASGAHTLRLQLADYGEVTAAIIVI